MNRVFGVALIVAVAYFIGELLFRTFTIPLGLVRVGAALVGIIFAPALPIRLVVRMSPTVALIIACLGWGVLVQIGYLVYKRVRSSMRPTVMR
jgi:hypothetical protein